MISVIVCTYNRCESLARTLQSLADMSVSTHEPWELVVVDNNSSDSTKSCVARFQNETRTPIRYIFEQRQGKPFALNTGIRSAAGEILLFTDDDVIVDRHWLTRLSETFNEPHCLGAGGKILPVWPGDKPSWLRTDGQYGLMSAIASYDLGDVPRELDYVRVPFGANAGFRKRAFEQYGYYRTDLGPSAGKDRIGGGGEDTEFARRLISAGEKLFYSPSAVVYHPVQPQRTGKRYFQLWHFEHGKSLMKLGNDTHSGVHYLGVPRFLFRSFLESSLKWLIALNPHKRFYHKLQVYLFAGEIVQAYRGRSVKC